MIKKNESVENPKQDEKPELLPIIPEQPELPIEKPEVIPEESPSEVPPAEIPQPNKKQLK